jgi:hypothetical protein
MALRYRPFALSLTASILLVALGVNPGVRAADPSAGSAVAGKEDSASVAAGTHWVLTVQGKTVTLKYERAVRMFSDSWRTNVTVVYLSNAPFRESSIFGYGGTFSPYLSEDEFVVSAEISDGHRVGPYAAYSRTKDWAVGSDHPWDSQILHGKFVPGPHNGPRRFDGQLSIDESNFSVAAAVDVPIVNPGPFAPTSLGSAPARAAIAYLAAMKAKDLTTMRGLAEIPEYFDTKAAGCLAEFSALASARPEKVAANKLAAKVRFVGTTFIMTLVKVQERWKVANDCEEVP